MPLGCFYSDEKTSDKYMYLFIKNELVRNRTTSFLIIIYIRSFHGICSHSAEFGARHHNSDSDSQNLPDEEVCERNLQAAWLCFSRGNEYINLYLQQRPFHEAAGSRNQSGASLASKGTPPVSARRQRVEGSGYQYLS